MTDPRDERAAAGDAAQQFRDLQRDLPKIWKVIQHGHPDAYTSVVVPSLSFDQSELAKIQGVSFYEERLLFTLIRLRDPRARVIYVTSQPVHPEIVEYYLQLLTGVPASHARRRLDLVCVFDASAKPLTEKILERPRVVRRLRDAIGDPRLAYLTCFNSTHRERDLALQLGIPLNGVDPDLLPLGTKTGSRRTFAEAGVELPLGFEDIKDRAQVVDALAALAEQRPGIASAIIKLNDSFAGEGNATFSYPKPLPRDKSARRGAIEEALEAIEWSSRSETLEEFLTKLARMGGIVEERIVGEEIHSPSVQLRVDPDGEVEIISTHDQVLGGPTAQGFVGCRFPARETYRPLIQDRAVKIGRVLSDKGVISRFAIDFVVARDGGGEWRCYAIEINLRMGGTTHPFMALQFLTGGEIDAGSGCFVTPQGTKKYYFATDQLKSPTYQGLLPEDFIEILMQHGLHFRPSTETGVLFHMIGALSQFGKIGVTCIGNSPEEADVFYQKTIKILDRATGFEGKPTRRLVLLFDAAVPKME